MITKNDRNTLTQIVKAFCSEMEAAGYWVGIYSSESFFNSEMNDGELTRYTHWVARWGKSKPAPASGAETQIWQFGGERTLSAVIRSTDRPVIRITAMWISRQRSRQQD